MRPYLLAETNWNSVKNQHFELAILPWGATEAHNYHLPYSTDNLESELIAAESARLAWEKGAKVIVLPNIPFGVNTGQRDIYLDININPSTQFAILSDIINVLNDQGIYKLIVFNSHGGNDFKTILRELGAKYPKMFLASTNWFNALDKQNYFDNLGDHADEMETSLMLYLRPDLVLPREYWGEGNEKKHKIKAFNEGWAWTERKWSQISTDTGVGDPRQATANKGSSYFKDISLLISELIIELCLVNTNNLYE